MHLDGPGARSCTKCNHPRALAKSDDPMDGPCPRCPGRLDGHNGTYACDTCGGYFVTHDRLAELRAAPGEVLARPLGAAGPSVGTTHYVKCPQCHELMSRKAFGARSGIVIDTCASHGAWFDFGELSSALRWTIPAPKEPSLELGRAREGEREPRPPQLDRTTNGDALTKVLEWLLE